MEAAMTVDYRKDRILVTASELKPGAVRQLNEILQEAGLGPRVLQPPEVSARAARAPALVALHVIGADPLAIRDVVQAFAQREGVAVPAVSLDIPHTAGTIDTGLFDAAGKKSGHGAAWFPAPADQMPAKPPWPQSSHHQVVALLDSGVQPHDWLPAGDHPPFFVNATAYGWPQPELPQPPNPPSQPPLGTHWGHATFLAGLIRMTAPDAQILSMQVMNAAGQVSDDQLVDALTWLADNQGRVRTDLVLMAFGRRRQEPDDPALDEVKKAISLLAGYGTKIVASAGNDGSALPVYPAAFAVDPDLSESVISVGALASPTQWAPFSDYGPWVREARKGAGIISALPQTTSSVGELQVSAKQAFDDLVMKRTQDGFAWWTGTSFAAALFAGQCARDLQGGEGLPEPDARP
jgi:subtilisin family serine protease